MGGGDVESQVGADQKGTRWRGSKVVQDLQVCLNVSLDVPNGCVPLGTYRMKETKGLIDGMGTVGLQGANGHNESIEGHGVYSMPCNSSWEATVPM